VAGSLHGRVSIHVRPRSRGESVSICTIYTNCRKDRYGSPGALMACANEPAPCRVERCERGSVL
jgi:hypothetical protein